MTTNGTTEKRIQYRTVAGRRMVMLDESEYRRLMLKADEWEPALPPPNADGRYPAIEYSRALLARKMIRMRRRAGFSQEELALAAGVRLETLRRIELVQSTPNIATLKKIESALEKAGAE